VRTTRSHYEVLGLPRNVNPAQIKRRYRELVRKFHPDVSKDKTTSHRLFLQINEAYEVLSDAVRRKAYDETLDLDDMIRSQRAARATTTTPSRPSAQPGPQTPSRKVAQLLRDAQFAFIQKRFSTATDLCKQALGIDSRNARAFAMLGDIYRAQGKTGAAIKYYNYAIQYDPKDSDSQKKLLNLIGKQVKAQRAHNTVRDPGKLRVVDAIWWSIVFLLIMLIRVYPGTPIPWLKTYIPQVSMWSWNLVGFIAGAAALAGALLSLNGLLMHPDNELVFDSGGTWVVVPLGFIFFPGAAGFYILLGVLQGSLSRSVLTVFGLVVGIVLFASLMCEPQARMQVLLFGGNVAFLSSLLGWYTGAALKPLSAE
jgi:curved DNA-binding protein CbpA